MLTGVTHEMRIMREEVFGPVLPIVVVDSEQEAIDLANDSEFGLGASVWTKDRQKGARIARRIESGMVWVNDHSFSHGAPGRRRRRGRLGAGARARGVHQQDGGPAARGRPGRDGGVRTMTARVLLIDNYDSFTYNLAHGLAELGAHVDVFRHDEITEDEADDAAADAPRHLAGPRAAVRDRHLAPT